LSSQNRSIQQLAHVAGIVEQLSLELSWQCVPLHNKRSSKTSQNLILGCKGRSIFFANGVFLLEQFIIIGKDCEHRESPLELLELLSFGRPDRGLRQVAILDCFCKVLLGREQPSIF